MSVCKMTTSRSAFARLWPMLVCLFALHTATAAHAKKAGPGEVCEEDKDLPRPPKRVLVLTPIPQKDAEPPLANAFAEDMRMSVSELDHVVLLSIDGALEAGASDTDSCARSSCLADIAEVTGVDYIVYGKLFKERLDDGLGWRVETRIFDADKGRPIDKIEAKSTEPALIGEALRTGVPTLVPPLPELKVVDCGPPDLPERPLFILGSAITLTGAVTTLGSVFWLLDLEDNLSRKDVHRGLKDESLNLWPYAVGAIAASSVVLVAGASVMTAGVFILPPEEDETPGGAE